MADPPLVNAREPGAPPPAHGESWKYRGAPFHLLREDERLDLIGRRSSALIRREGDDVTYTADGRTVRLPRIARYSHLP